MKVLVLHRATLEQPYEQTDGFNLVKIDEVCSRLRHYLQLITSLQLTNLNIICDKKVRLNWDNGGSRFTPVLVLIIKLTKGKLGLICKL